MEISNHLAINTNLIFSALIGYCVFTISSNSKSKLSNMFLLKFFAANILVNFSQMYNVLVQMYGTMTCTNRVACYLTHQIGECNKFIFFTCLYHDNSSTYSPILDYELGVKTMIIIIDPNNTNFIIYLPQSIEY